MQGRCIDLSRAAANAIGMGGTARVAVDNGLSTIKAHGQIVSLTVKSGAAAGNRGGFSVSVAAQDRVAPVAQSLLREVSYRKQPNTGKSPGNSGETAATY